MKNIPYEDHKDIKALWAKHGGHQEFRGQECAVIGMDKLMAFVEDVRRLAMTTDDGGYMCTPDHALEVAQMVSNCESMFTGQGGCYQDQHDVVDLLKDYLDGEKDVKEVNAGVAEIHKDIAKEKAEKEAKKAAKEFLTPTAKD